MRAHRLFLARLALAQPVLFEQLAHHVAACQRAHLAQAPADLAARQIRPQHTLAHRVARRELGQQCEKILVERGCAGNQRLASTAFFRTRPGARSSGSASSVNPRRTVLASRPNKPAMALMPPLPSLVALRLNRRVAPSVLFRQRRKQSLHLHLNVLPVTRLCAHLWILCTRPATSKKPSGNARFLSGIGS